MLKHIAIIMDGNGRWANSKFLPRTAGHKKGAEAAKEVIIGCKESGIKYLTLYTFSSENWNRPADEVSDLMNLLAFYLEKELDNLHKNGVRVFIIGDREKLPDGIASKIENAEKLTENNKDLYLNIALSYGSRQEIARATRKLAKNVAKGRINPDEIDENTISDYLYTKDIPDPDLLIRTGGEQRISNFLLWQCAYTEFYFTDILWPNFGKKELEEAISEFNNRERRFGNTNTQKAS